VVTKKSAADADETAPPRVIAAMSVMPNPPAAIFEVFM
jgi:hypothetical protein